MTNLRTYVAMSATAAIIAFGQNAFGQDDLDDLLADLEGEAPAAAAPAATAEEKAEEPAAEEKAEEPAAEEKAEEPAAEEPAAEEKAEEPAAEEPAAEEKAEEPAAEEPAAEEKAEEPAAEEPAAEEKAEEPAAEEPAAEEKAEEPAAEEPAAEEKAEEPAAEEPAAEEPVAEEKATEEKVDDTLNLLDELAAEDNTTSTETPAAEEKTEEPAVADSDEVPDPDNEPEVVDKPDATSRPDGKLIDEILTAERLRRKAMDDQALREINEARDAMASGEYAEAVRHYGLAAKLLNDRPDSKKYKLECRVGIADGLYKAALEEERTGRRVRAIKLMEKALDLRHPKARRQLEAWLNAEDPDANKTDVSEILHRRNEADYKARRETERRHLKRARQLLAQRELDSALDECELVLVKDPYNQEALRLRDSIVRKRDVILKQERKVAREKWIADVDAAWRPPYAVNATDTDEKKGATVKAKPDPNSERTVEQTIVQRMKAMRLPAISFKPPATIIDAVEYFRGASKDFDDPARPLEQRGFNFVLKTPEAVRMHASAAPSEDADDFSDTGSDEAANAGGPIGVPVIPMITASDITFYDALKLVCESVEYKFTVQGPIVMVMHKDMSVEELVTRSFPVLSSFTEKMGSATEDIKSMKSSTGFGGGASRKDDEGEENEQRDWKEFFSLLGVKWPEGSSIFYVKTVGRLFVKNTQENLAEFENVLAQLNQQVTLVEIETRFIEVCQDDLNSLGFEWILNSDYTLGLNRHLARALGMRDGAFSSELGPRWPQNSAKPQYWTTSTSTTPGSSGGSGGSAGNEPSGGNPTTNAGGGSAGSGSSSQPVTTTTLIPPAISGGTGATSWKHWSASNRNPWQNRSSRNAGINAFGDEYSTGQRYLSTLNNHISGESKSTNDQFMRLNAFLGSADLSMILHMLSQRSDTDLLSAPKVLTRPGEEAVMKVVTEYIYPTDYDVQLQSSSSGSGGSYGGGSQSAILAVVEPQSFTMREVGVILQVTPTLTDDGNVVDLELNTQVVDEPTWKNYGMKIPFTGNSSQMQNFMGIGDILTGLAEVLTTLGTGISDAMKADFANTAVNSASRALDNLTATGNDNMTYYDAPMEQPFFHVRSVDSKVSVYPGATIVMGGLITEMRKAMDDKIPFLGDIPFIGRLFRSHSEQTSKRNLLIFVTTRIVDGRGREMHNDGFELTEQTSGADVKEAPETEAK